MTSVHLSGSPNPAARLPIVDLAAPDCASTVREACVEYGFFYLVNHGVDQELVESVLEQSRKFFSLPLDRKNQLLRHHHRGYTPLFSENLDPSSSSKGDSKESFYIGPLEGDTLNQWPPPGRQICCQVGESRWRHTMRNFCDCTEETIGASAHSDYGMITLLMTDGVPGLQVCKEKDKQPRIWEDVLHVKGAFIVNIGDMMERWTNYLFRSTLHRVMPVGQERYSMAFFLDPNPDCIVECLETCCSTSCPKRFQPVRSGNYLKERFLLTYGS